VTYDRTAQAAGSSLMPVFATPFLVALMEGAAVSALEPFLQEGEGSVGTMVHVSHTAATPVGMTVWAEAVVTGVEGRRVFFEVSAWDETGPVGSGQHERAIIRNERFLEKVNAKAKK
jgi:predicted thioesterase